MPFCVMLVVVLMGSADAIEPPPSFTAVCTRVFDGDTIGVTGRDGKVIRVRYAGIDAPEFDEPGGRRAQALNRVLVLDREVHLAPAARQRDPYGRLVAHPTVCGVDVERALLAAGLARAWRD